MFYALNFCYVLSHKQYSYNKDNNNNNNNNTNNNNNSTTNNTTTTTKNNNNNNSVVIRDISIFDDTFKFYKMWSIYVNN